MESLFESWDSASDWMCPELSGLRYWEEKKFDLELKRLSIC